MTTAEAIRVLCDCARHVLNPDEIQQAKRRHAAVLDWADTDYLPLGGIGRAGALPEGLPDYHWAEQFDDPARSFVMQMKGVIAQASTHSDCVPGLRADTGVINGPALFGVDYVVPEHTKPVVSRYVPKAAMRDFVLPDDISSLGACPRIVEHMEFHQATLRAHGLDGRVDLFHCDTQGPFDIAAQTIGHEIFTEVYDDPAYVHHVMAQATKAYVALSRLCKRVAGDEDRPGNASWFWMNRGAVRMCDDSGILLSAPLYAEFALPYHRQAFENLGGGWLHYCGGVRGGGRAEGLRLHDLYRSIPLMRGINFTTGRDFMGEIRRMIEGRVVFIGSPWRDEGEDLKAFLKRVLSACTEKRGLLLWGPSVSDEEKPSALGIWHRLQDERFK